MPHKYFQKEKQMQLHNDLKRKQNTRGMIKSFPDSAGMVGAATYNQTHRLPELQLTPSLERTLLGGQMGSGNLAMSRQLRVPIPLNFSLDGATSFHHQIDSFHPGSGLCELNAFVAPPSNGLRYNVLAVSPPQNSNVMYPEHSFPSPPHLLNTPLVSSEPYRTFNQRQNAKFEPISLPQNNGYFYSDFTIADRQGCNSLLMAQNGVHPMQFSTMEPQYPPITLLSPTELIKSPSAANVFNPTQFKQEKLDSNLPIDGASCAMANGGTCCQGYGGLGDIADIMAESVDSGQLEVSLGTNMAVDLPSIGSFLDYLNE